MTNTLCRLRPVFKQKHVRNAVPQQHAAAVLSYGVEEKNRRARIAQRTRCLPIKIVARAHPLSIQRNNKALFACCLSRFRGGKKTMSTRCRIILVAQRHVSSYIEHIMNQKLWVRLNKKLIFLSPYKMTRHVHSRFDYRIF